MCSKSRKKWRPSTRGVFVGVLSELQCRGYERVELQGTLDRRPETVALL